MCRSTIEGFASLPSFIESWKLRWSLPDCAGWRIALVAFGIGTWKSVGKLVLVWSIPYYFQKVAQDELCATHCFSRRRPIGLLCRFIRMIFVIMLDDYVYL